MSTTRCEVGGNESRRLGYINSKEGTKGGGEVQKEHAKQKKRTLKKSGESKPPL